MAFLQQVSSLLRAASSVLSVCVGVSGAAVAGDAGAWSPVPPTAVFETGDTWRVDALRYRLYGVQACIRGTTYTGSDGRGRDCGEVSLAMLAGLIRTLKPFCTPVAHRPDIGTAFVVCYADAPGALGRRIDLGTALIAGGFAFAALDAGGRSVNAAYRVAEEEARRSRAGLWTARDVPDPNAMLFKALPAKSGILR